MRGCLNKDLLRLFCSVVFFNLNIFISRQHWEAVFHFGLIWFGVFVFICLLIFIISTLFSVFPSENYYSDVGSLVVTLYAFFNFRL